MESTLLGSFFFAEQNYVRKKFVVGPHDKITAGLTRKI